MSQQPRDGVTIELTAEEWEELLERHCQHRLGHGIDLFRERWASGEYNWSHDLENHCDVVSVAMLAGVD